ncbi:MAG: quinolinate synthase NadA [Clostridia bacterium]|nr:quinolinate synthase NadA [Clostridia bacterium]
MTIREYQEEILRLKREKNACILVHAYQSHDIWEVADYIGDSFGLSQDAAKTDADVVIMCGVRFMAETAKILSPDKRVYLPNPVAGCPMAEQFSLDELKELRAQMPDRTVVAYINTTSELKTACDVCVTSSSAVKIVRAVPNDKILFIPDCQLGAWVQEQVPDKDIALVRGGCPVHLRVTVEDVERARRLHPQAELLVHPECPPAVTALADYAGSTTGIMAYAEKSAAKEFIIGTENSIVTHLQFSCPDKRFYPLSHRCVCHNMAVTTLADVYNCLRGEGGEEIVLPDDVSAGAKRCIDEMLRLG